MKKLILIFILFTTILLGDSRVYHKKVDVIKSEPLYKTITKKVPYEECYDQEYEQRVPIHRNSNKRSNNSIGLDTLIGVTGGVVVGNQIGKGNGKVAAKIIGGLLGGAIANGMREDKGHYSNRDDYYYETKSIRKCQTKYDNYDEEVQVGYKNYFLYNGSEIYKITKRPRKHIRIKNTLTF